MSRPADPDTVVTGPGPDESDTVVVGGGPAPDESETVVVGTDTARGAGGVPPASRRARIAPLAPRPLSPHSGPGARPTTPPVDRSARRRRRALVAAAGVLLVGAVGFAATATALPTGESWGAELAISGGDDVNVGLVNGAVRLVAPSTREARSQGTLVLTPRRPAAPTNAIEAELTDDLPPGTDTRVDVRGILPDGRWSPWLATVDGERTVLPAMTTQVQARIVLLGGPGLVSPAVQRLWLTTSTTDAAPTAPVAPPVAPPAGSSANSAPKPTPSAQPTPSGEPTPSAQPTPSGGATSTTAPSTIPTGNPSETTSSPAPSTSASQPAPAPEPARALWSADITAQGRGMFKDTPYNFQGAPEPTVVDATDVPGAKALRFTMPGGAQRAEIEPNVPNLLEGQERFFRLTVRLEPGFPVDTDDFQLITQFKNEGTGSPPVELTVNGGNFALSGGFGFPDGPRTFEQVIGPAPTGRVVTVVLRVLFSSDPAKGSIDAWLDGQRTVTGFRPPGGTLYPGNFSYWKLGLYRDRSINEPATYQLSDARLGESYESVAGPLPAAD